MDAHLETHEPVDLRWPLTKFFLATIGQFLLALWLFSWLAPATFSAELAQPGLIVLWTFLFGIPSSLFEYLYHRYLLHSAVFPFMAVMHHAHAHHHGITNVKAPITAKEPEKLVEVASDYPIEHQHQEEAMMFPFFSSSIFYGIFLLVVGLPAKLLFPSQPIILATILGVTLHYAGYELWHQVLHLSHEKYWGRWMRNRTFGGMFRYIYSFHLMHHWRPVCNLAVVGFWGFALWDHLFRTHRRPERIPLDGSMVSYLDAKLAQPLLPIRILDRWQAGMYRWSRSVERWTKQVFLRKSDGRDRQ